MLIIIFQFGVNSNQHHYLPLSGFKIYVTIIAGHQRGNNIDGIEDGEESFYFICKALFSIHIKQSL